jgi:hypothetical protein
MLSQDALIVQIFINILNNAKNVLFKKEPSDYDKYK